MSRKSASFFAGVFALSICSCTNNTDLTELKAELEAARKEAAEAKALAESVKAELAKDKDAIEATKLADAKARAAAEVAKIKLAKDMTELVKRWNAVAADYPADLPTFGRGPVTFNWDGTHFPHPTFKLGTAEAYGAFAKVLLAFLERGDNFDFLASNKLFQVNLRSGVPGPGGPDVGWTLAALTEQFASSGGHGNHDELTRKSLKAYSDRIQASTRK